MELVYASVVQVPSTRACEQVEDVVDDAFERGWQGVHSEIRQSAAQKLHTFGEAPMTYFPPARHHVSC